MHRPPATYQVEGTAIRTRRMHLGMSTKDCAAHAEISKTYLIQLELGWRKNMRPPTYQRLRAVLDVPADDERLLTPTEDPPRKESHARPEGAPRQDEAPG